MFKNNVEKAMNYCLDMSHDHSGLERKWKRWMRREWDENEWNDEMRWDDFPLSNDINDEWDISYNWL